MRTQKLFFWAMIVMVLACEENIIDEEYIQEPEYQESIRNQKDFFTRNQPGSLLIENRTSRNEQRIHSNFDLSMYSDETIESTGIPLLKSPKRYNQKKVKPDFSRLMPSNAGPTGLIDTISAKGLEKGKFSMAYLHGFTKVTDKNLFQNVQNYDSTDVQFILNHGFSQNFEFFLKSMKSDRRVENTRGRIFDSALDPFPEYSYGLKAHQNWRGKEFAIGFINTPIDSVTRNMILDQDFEYYKSLYLSMTTDLTYRTESHLTIKKNSSDNKYIRDNSWMAALFGVDTKLTKDTHLIGEIKFEDYNANIAKWTVNGGLRHSMSSDSTVDFFVRRGNEQGISETGFKISGAF